MTKKKDKKTNNDIQNKLKIVGVPEGWTVPAPLLTPVVFNLVTNSVISHE
jgi:hypothetical protein